MLHSYVVSLHLFEAHYEDPTLAVVQHFDRRPIQAAQLLRRNDLVNRADRNMSSREIQHAVDDGQDGVHVVGHQHHCEASFACELRDAQLTAQIKAGEWLVEQQQARLPNQGLRQEQALLLTPRQLPDGPVGIRRRLHRVERCLDAGMLLPPGWSGKREAPAQSIQPQHHQITPSHWQVRVEKTSLRHIADRGIASPRSASQHRHAALAGAQESEQQAQQGGLAGAIGTQDRHELSWLDLERRLTPDRALPQLDRRVLKGHDVRVLSAPLQTVANAGLQGSGQHSRREYGPLAHLAFVLHSILLIGWLQAPSNDVTCRAHWRSTRSAAPAVVPSASPGSWHRGAGWSPTRPQSECS